MSELERHALPRADLQPQLIYRTARNRDDRLVEPEVVSGHSVPAPDQDGFGGLTLHFEGPWRCRCETPLAMDYREIPAAWAVHAATKTGMSVEHLAAHMLEAVREHLPIAVCSCGWSFRAPADDPTNGDAAVALWAAHVEAAGS